LAWYVKPSSWATGDLGSIQDNLRKKIIEDLKILSTNPVLFGGNIKKLRGFKPPLYRLRSGGHRVPYRVKGEIVKIMRVIDRKDYQKI